MSIKEITVAVCDWCGGMEKAIVWGYQYNEPCYEYPKGWVKSPYNDMVVCPGCAECMGLKGENKK